MNSFVVWICFFVNILLCEFVCRIYSSAIHFFAWKFYHFAWFINFVDFEWFFALWGSIHFVDLSPSRRSIHFVDKKFSLSGGSCPLGGPSTLWICYKFYPLEGPSTLWTKIFHPLMKSPLLGGPSTLWTCYKFYPLEGPSILWTKIFHPLVRSRPLWDLSILRTCYKFYPLEGLSTLWTKIFEPLVGPSTFVD